MQGRFQGLANEYVFRDLVEQRTRSKGPLIKRYESSYEQRQERDSKEIPEYRSLEMGDATEGYLSVLHDSVSLRENHPIIGPWLVEDAGNLNIARVQWNAGGESVSVCWVGAIFRSFLELDQFTHAWRHCLRASKVSKRGNTEINPQTIQEMACHWIGIGCALLLGETYHPSDFVDLEHDSPKYDILGLVKKMECLIGNTRKFGIWRRDRTLLHFAVLLSFESGIPSEFSGPFWESETLVRFWKGRQSDIQRIRSRLLGVNRFEWNNLQKAVAKPRNLVKDIHDQLLGGPSGHRDRKEPLDSKDEPILKILEGIVRGESLNDEAPTRKLGTLLRKSSFGKKYGKPGALLESFIAIIESSLIHPSNRISGICFDDETN